MISSGNFYPQMHDKTEVGWKECMLHVLKLELEYSVRIFGYKIDDV